MFLTLNIYLCDTLAFIHIFIFLYIKLRELDFLRFSERCCLVPQTKLIPVCAVSPHIIS